MIENIETLVLESPALLVALTIVMILSYHWQRGLSYREFMAVHTAKSLLFRALDSWARKKGRPLVRYKNYQDDEYITTVKESPYNVAQTLQDNGFSPHVFATLKVRGSGNRSQACHSQWSKQAEDERQVEVYIFRADNGLTEIYAHSEGSILNPEKHLEGKQTNGSDMVREIFD